MGCGCSSPHLEVIDVDVESPALVFSQRIGELLVGFAQNAMLGILQRLSIVVSLPGPTISLLFKLWGFFGRCRSTAWHSL